MTTFFFKGWTRNLEIRNTPVWVLFNIWRLWQVRDTKFGTNVPNKMLLNAAKCQGYSFYGFSFIMGKPTTEARRGGVGGGKITTPLSTQVRVKHSFILWKCSTFFFINEFFKTQNLFGGMFFIKSYNQVFIMRYLFLPTGFYKVRVPDTCINNSYINL